MWRSDWPDTVQVFAINEKWRMRRISERVASKKNREIPGFLYV